MNHEKIIISGRAYIRSPKVDRYQIHLDELEGLRMCDIPPHSHLEILGLPEIAGAYESEWYALNNGDGDDSASLSFYGGVGFRGTSEELPHNVSRLRRAFDALASEWVSLQGKIEISARAVDGEFLAFAFLNRNFGDRPAVLVRDAVSPVADALERLTKPDVQVFICHASEDKPAARAIAAALDSLGVKVWLDEQQIRVGDSIVQRIGDALGDVTHLIVLLSRSAIQKPWVWKELSSALMMQLSQRSVGVLPVRLDDCTIPPILADLKYADARLGIDQAIAGLEQALFHQPDAGWSEDPHISYRLLAGNGRETHSEGGVQ